MQEQIFTATRRVPQFREMSLLKLKRAVLVSADAEGGTKLNAFDNALLKAGIGNANLVKLSSVVPPDIEWLSEPPSFPLGSVIFVVLSHIESDAHGKKISAAVGVGLCRNEGGLIYEFSGECDGEEAMETVKRMVEEGFAVRNWKLSELKIAVAEHSVEKNGCALAGVVFFP